MDLTFEPIFDDILNKHFTNVFRSGYINVKGTTLTDNYKNIYKHIDNFTVYDDDIWVCSFPKTGTTWTQELVWMIVNDLNYKMGEISILERFPFFDYSIVFDYKNVYSENTDFNPPELFANAISFISKLKRPRLIKTHLPWNLLPKDIRDGLKHPKIIYITRNPKDVCVSYYHHCKLIENYRGKFSDFCNLFLSGRLCYAPYWNNVLPYWEKRNQPNVLFLQFEELKENLSNVIKNVANFLSKTLTEENVNTLLDHLSFISMKANKAVNYEDFLEWHRKYKLIDTDGSFIRSGTVGNKELTDEQIEKFDMWIQEHAPCNKLSCLPV